MKLKIALRNLIISQAIILVFLILTYFLWFPHSFTHLGGFYKTAWMIIFVDIIVGPLLVFLIYKENKKYLAFDINVLLSIQLIAFIFGAYSLYLKHPAYAVFSIDRFVLTNVSNIYPQPSWLNQAKFHFFSKPKFVIAHLPDNIEERNNLMLNVGLNGQPDIDSRPKYFSPLKEHIDSVMKKSIQLEQLNLDLKAKTILDKFSEEYAGKLDNFGYFPLRGNIDKDMIWVLHKKTGTPITILDIDPWKLKLASNLNDN